MTSTNQQSQFQPDELGTKSRKYGNNKGKKYQNKTGKSPQVIQTKGE